MSVVMVAACAPSTNHFPAPPRTRPLEHGVFLPEHLQFAEAFSRYSSMVGSTPQWLLLFRDWTHEAPPLAALDAALGQGVMPVLTWEPWYAPSEGAAPTDAAPQPAFALSRLLAGDHDHRVSTWAETLASWGREVVMRFAHEMNGNWYPWGAGVQSNTAEQYVQAWRYVHKRFTEAGAHNVSWCWAPNVPVSDPNDPTGDRLASFFPGRDVVDLLGIDGYNWGSAPPSMSWTPPSDLFGRGFQELRALNSGLPIVVTETGSVEGTQPGQSKADWIAQLFDYLEEQGDVRAVIWFQAEKENDWRINSSAAAEAAYRRAVAEVR